MPMKYGSACPHCMSDYSICQCVGDDCFMLTSMCPKTSQDVQHRSTPKPFHEVCPVMVLIVVLFAVGLSAIQYGSPPLSAWITQLAGPGTRP